MYLHYVLIYLFVLYSKRYDFNLYLLFVNYIQRMGIKIGIWV